MKGRCTTKSQPLPYVITVVSQGIDSGNRFFHFRHELVQVKEVSLAEELYQKGLSKAHNSDKILDPYTCIQRHKSNMRGFFQSRCPRMNVSELEGLLARNGRLLDTGGEMIGKKTFFNQRENRLCKSEIEDFHN